MRTNGLKIEKRRIPKNDACALAVLAGTVDTGTLLFRRSTVIRRGSRAVRAKRINHRSRRVFESAARV